MQTPLLTENDSRFFVEFRQTFIKVGPKNYAFDRKAECWLSKLLKNFLLSFGGRSAVQMCANLLDLENVFVHTINTSNIINTINMKTRKAKKRQVPVKRDWRCMLPLSLWKNWWIKFNRFRWPIWYSFSLHTIKKFFNDSPRITSTLLCRYEIT